MFTNSHGIWFPYTPSMKNVVEKERLPKGRTRKIRTFEMEQKYVRRFKVMGSKRIGGAP